MKYRSLTASAFFALSTALAVTTLPMSMATLITLMGITSLSAAQARWPTGSSKVSTRIKAGRVEMN
jgi:hypothetical protein